MQGRFRNLECVDVCWLRAEVNDEDFWTELPAALRTDMALELARPLFAHSDIFRALDKSAERQVFVTDWHL
jgi:hypothetical protein